MNYHVITKPKLEEIEVRPNLEEYHDLANSFSWQGLRQQLDGLPDDGLNLAYEAIDRHSLGSRANKVALYWEGTEGEEERYTFAQMKELTDKFANVLKNLGVEKGDRVFLFMGRIPELYVAFFGILKIGAIAGPLFSAFGPDPVKDRLLDSGARVLIVTPDLRNRVSHILEELPDLRHVVVVNKNGRFQGPMVTGDISYEKEMASSSPSFQIVPTTEEDFSIMHYTSGTTGKPKGAVHAHLAVLQHMATGRWVLDLHDDDIYWCTADPGWVTGTSYGISAPWVNGISQVIYEGGFRASTWYQVIQKYGVTVWYTAPTAIRMLMRAGDEIPKRYDLSSLRHMCSVGEPLNPEAIVWGLRTLKLPFHDNWWQTETGAILIANYPVQDIRPGSMGRPIPGVTAAIVDEAGIEVELGLEGDLAIRPGWPSMFRTYWRNQEMYDSKFRNGWYVTGDRARMDSDGYFWFVGRADDVINTAGHLVGPFEVESALIEHPSVAEAGVIGKPDPVAFEVVKAFVALNEGYQPTDELRRDIMRFVRQKLAAAVAPREIQFLESLPKTRSGKIMRRLLKARDMGLPEGDTSTLEDD